MTDLSAKPRVLFVSSAEDGFSQVAQVVVSQFAGSALKTLTAAIAPGERISQEWMELLRNRGYQFSPQRPMPIEEVDQGTYDAVISFGAEDIAPWISAMIRENWNMKEQSDSEFERIKLLGEIEKKLERLVSRICATGESADAATNKRA